MEINKLMEWNPWWENKGLIEKFKGKHRPQYDLLVNSTGIKEITIITGIRRAGKSTLMYQMIDNLLKKNSPQQILLVNLEDKKLTKDTLDDIYQSYRENINPEKKAYIFFDEIHKKDGWESWLRKKYDLKTNDKFIISGSCSYLLKKEYSTLLTGRNLTFEVFPLSFEEFLLFKNIKMNKSSLKKNLLLEKTKLVILRHLKEYLNLGGFPEIVFKLEDYKRQILKQYFDDILYKDIIDRYNSNSQKTKDLALFLITNFTGLISLRNLRSLLGMSYDTIKDYLSYYKEAFLFFTLDHFSYSLKEQKTLASKIYCIDNGLRNAVSFTFSKDEGKLVENLVLVELKRRENDVYYWNAKKSKISGTPEMQSISKRNKGEIDFVVKNTENALIALNVSYTNEIEEREVKALHEFKKLFKKTKELIILTKDLEKKEKGIKFIPLWKWLLV
ncbi:MAG: ATP-binding protein [Nanoarchaeota archaeon]|nr:ATP-binding protein [Nanoarchaeota archaeon]